MLTPSWTPLRITGTGDHYSVEGRLANPNGEVWHFVDLFDLRDGKVIKVTEYFGAPLPAAEWRAPWVEIAEAPLGQEPGATVPSHTQRFTKVRSFRERAVALAIS